MEKPDTETVDTGATDNAGMEFDLEDTSAGTENTDTSDGTEGQDATDDGGDAGAEGKDSPESPVPYARFQQVAKDRTSLREQNEALRLENERLKAAAEKPASATEVKPDQPAAPAWTDFKPAPKGLTPAQELDWYNRQSIEHHGREVVRETLKEFFGENATPEMVRGALGAAVEQTQRSHVQNFVAAATARGLDPESVHLREAVGNMMDSGKFGYDFGAAMDALTGATRKPAAGNATKPDQPNKPGAGVRAPERGGADVPRSVSRANLIPTREQAAELASQGKKIRQVSITDILRAGSRK